MRGVWVRVRGPEKLCFSLAFLPDSALNRAFCEKQDELAVSKTLSEMEFGQLVIRNVGNFETLAFNQQTSSAVAP